jgi:catechol 2,3-dioxygenase-like lactoylglutathione lyase family enzyme
MPTTTIPLLPCVDVDRTVDFYGALGFTVTHHQERPYLYLALTLSDVELHFKQPPPGVDPADELTGGCLVLVDDVVPLHRQFAASLRARHGRVLATGRPRLARLRLGQSRFCVFDPSGNVVLFIDRDEPDVEYGGSTALTGLAKAHDNVRIFRDFKNDDVLAARALDAALNRYGANGSRIDVARALADRAELAVALGDAATADRVRRELSDMHLSDGERAEIATELTALDQIDEWMAH